MSSVDDVVREMEAVEWSAVPTISTAEAAAFTQRLIAARDAEEAEEVEVHAA